MRVGIVGASASGIYVAMLTKRLHPDWGVALFDHAPKLAKKLYATGNGHCNLLNASIDPGKYSNPDFVASVIDGRPLEYWLSLLGEFGIPTTRIGDLIYPLTYSAASYVNALTHILQKEDVSIHLGCNVTGYRVSDQIELDTTEGRFTFDRLVIACGGKSQKNLGSDGSLFGVLSDHRYAISPLLPGLCPIKTIEQPKSLDGLRHKALVKLIQKGKTLYEERGEVLFRKDGLSGIAIFNLASIIARRGLDDEYDIAIDLFPDMRAAELKEIAERAKKTFGANYLSAIVEKPLADYIARLGGNAIEVTKNLRFHFSALSSFEQSQVTVGGVKLSEISANLESKRENGVFFAGEVLDVDGLCGGFNLGWCLFSAARVAESL